MLSCIYVAISSKDFMKNKLGRLDIELDVWSMVCTYNWLLVVKCGNFFCFPGATQSAIRGARPPHRGKRGHSPRNTWKLSRRGPLNVFYECRPFDLFSQVSFPGSDRKFYKVTYFLRNFSATYSSDDTIWPGYMKVEGQSKYCFRSKFQGLFARMGRFRR